jgi:hypothetical protein
VQLRTGRRCSSKHENGGHGGGAGVSDAYSAYVLGYDAARFAFIALLAQQGLRATSSGGHYVVVTSGPGSVRRRIPAVRGSRRTPTNEQFTYWLGAGDLGVHGGDGRRDFGLLPCGRAVSRNGELVERHASSSMAPRSRWSFASPGLTEPMTQAGFL